MIDNISVKCLPVDAIDGSEYTANKMEVAVDGKAVDVGDITVFAKHGAQGEQGVSVVDIVQEGEPLDLTDFKGTPGKSALTEQLYTDMYITPTVKEGVDVAINDPQQCIKVGDIYYQWILYNPNVKYDKKFSNTDMGSSSWLLTTSKDLVKWENQKVVLTPGVYGDREIKSLMSGSVVEYKGAYHYYASVDLGSGDGVVGHWVAQSITAIPEFIGYIDLVTDGSIIARDPHVFWNAETKRLNMLLSCKLDNESPAVIRIFSSDDGHKWIRRYLFALPNVGIVECARLYNTKKYGWVLSYGLNRSGKKDPFGNKGFTSTNIIKVKFDNERLVLVGNLEDARVDFGSDYYAASLFEDKDDVYVFAWCNSWDYFPNILQKEFNGYVVVNRLIWNTEKQGFRQQLLPGIAEKYTCSMGKKDILLEKEYSAFPSRQIPFSCLQRIRFKEKDIADGEMFRFSHGGVSGLNLERCARKNASGDFVDGWLISRKDYGYSPVLDISSWNNFIFIPDNRKSKTDPLEIVINKTANVVQFYIDTDICATVLCNFPAGNPTFSFSGNVFYKNGKEIGRNTYTIDYELFYNQPLSGAVGGFSYAEAKNIIGQTAASLVGTFESASENAVKQVTVDNKKGIVVRTYLGEEIVDVPEGFYGHLVKPQDLSLLIKTSDNKNDTPVRALYLNSDKTVTYKTDTGFVVGNIKGSDGSPGEPGKDGIVERITRIEVVYA